MQKYEEVFDGIKEIIKKNDYSQPIKYYDNYVKIKFNTDDNIPLNKIIYFPTTTIIIRSITQKDGKYYPQLLQYDSIDISEGSDTNKTSASKECNICHYWYFLDKNFDYEPYLCNGCHDLMQRAINFNDVTVVSIKRNDYRIHFWCMSKKDAIVLMTNSNLNDKNGIL